MDLTTFLFSENKSMVLKGVQRVCSDESLLIFKRIGVNNEVLALSQRSGRFTSSIVGVPLVSYGLGCFRTGLWEATGFLSIQFVARLVEKDGAIV